jgi:N-acetylglucosamine kinase-like BadF-type ATPase
MSILIVDAGSTKTEWVVLENKKVINRLITRGYNPNYADPIVLIDILYKELGELPPVDEVYYYGSGCGSETVQQEVRQYLKVRFEEAHDVFVTHDLMGAAHAVLGKQPGIACILGTGANSCLYDGENIVERAVSLGYLVGDEGSGCYIGRKLARAYFYDLMPLELKLSFNDTYHLEIREFINSVYHKPEASKYLAGFMKFAGDHIDHPYIQRMVKDCFNDFIQAFVLRYKDCRNMRVSFVGSVAFYFQTLLYECLSAMDGLIQMYS